MPLRFSIIVPTLNRLQMLRTALASVHAQKWPKVEIIVVDGGSKDGTVEELDSSPDVCLISGPDNGVYDAFNKGLDRACGDVVGILNSDDWYEPGAFSAIANAFAAQAQAVCGTALVVQDDLIVERFDRDFDKSIASPRTTLIGPCSTNARFFLRAAIKRVGKFSLEYKYVSDRDWLTRWYEEGFVTATIPNVVYRYRQHPGSLTFDVDRSRELAIREDLVRLARYWRNNVRASKETRYYATLLEGRCLAYLALAALQGHQFSEVRHWLIDKDGRASIDPIAAIIRSGPDWIFETLKASPKPRPGKLI
jgi:glycosyltransferase involved in cell wall biosynthesis